MPLLSFQRWNLGVFVVQEDPSTLLLLDSRQSKIEALRAQMTEKDIVIADLVLALI